MEKSIKQKIADTNQRYLTGMLDSGIPDKLLSQLEAMDWGLLDALGKRSGSRGEFMPLGAMELSEIQAKRDEFNAIGLEAIRAGKVGAVILAGGQGTRLGFDKAKGMYDIGLTRHLYIFEQLIANLIDVVREAGAWVPLYVMTSEKNDGETREFFEEHSYFGYDSAHVKLFVQGMAPAVDFGGNLLLESPDSLAMSPNGNGGWFASMLDAGLDEDMRARGIEWLDAVAVDNVLQRIADPVFVGATIASGCACGAKVIRKNDPYERVG
ncbi:MAG: UTP--glucose-1-phosphate uridylyltransferase, partial [Clostridiales bacterium]|nr:UTP--glucose-1-phosphate uridylyltransferase [Clostridiales bacterium]